MSDNEIFSSQKSNLTDMPNDISSNDSDKENDLTIQTKRGPNRKFLFDQSYPSLDIAESILKSEIIWSIIKRKRKTKLGFKQDYRCNLTTYRGVQCSSAVYILLHQTDLGVSIYRTYCAHSLPKIEKLYL